MLNFSVNLDYAAYRTTIVRALPDWLTEPLRVVKEIIISSGYRVKSGRRGPVRQRSARGESYASQTKRLEHSISNPAMVSATKAQMIIAAPYAAYLNDPAGLNRVFVEPAIEEMLVRYSPAGAI